MNKNAQDKPINVCYIGLGSNQGDSRKILELAVSAIGSIDGVKIIAFSRIFHTEPQGDKDQPWFLNQVVKIACTLEPERLLLQLQGIENKLGRMRTERRYGPRSIDLDILLYGRALINTPNLVVPHPRMYERAFVLLPLQELSPDLILPDGSSIAEHLEKLEFSLNGDKIYQKL